MVTLALRCEQAVGADRELDEAIQASLVGAEVEWQDYIRANAYYRAGRWVSIGAIQPYTSSLDAAMTLLDGSTFFHVSRFDADADGRSEAHVYPNRCVGDDHKADAATPALALAAAALRARAALSEQPSPTEEAA